MEFNLDAAIAQEASRTNEEGAANNASQENLNDNPAGDNQPGDNDNSEGDNNPAVETKADAPASQQQPNGDNAEDLFTPQLELISKGRFKNSADLLTAIENLDRFDTVSRELEDFKAKNPFADEFEQKRNELKLAGATKEQLKSFEELNDLGDITSLEPRDAKVMKLMLIDGFPKKLAEAKVDKEFPLESTYDETEKELLEHEFAKSAKEDVKALEAYKVQVSTPSTDRVLTSQVDKAKLEAELNPVLDDFKQRYSTLTTLNLNGEEGEKGVNFDVSVDDAGKSQIADGIKEYFVENGIPLTQENYDEALDYARGQYLKENLPVITQKIWKQAEAHFTKFYTEKYENQGGLPRGDRKPGGGLNSTDAETKALKNELMGGPLK